MDLIVWFDDDHTNIKGFQFCYRKGKEEKALTWQHKGGYTHTTIDDGETGVGGHKMSPVLIPNGPVSRAQVTQSTLLAYIGVRC